MTKTNSRLVSLAKYKGRLEELIIQDEFKQLLNQEPPAQWVHTHPFAKSVKYIPIEIIESMLDKLFGEWRVVVLREGQLFNSIYVCVRVHYKNPLTGEWGHQDGIGAVAVQTETGKSAADLAAIKSNAVMLGLPAAKSFAIKDAVEHLGKLFGRDLNRKEVVAFTPSYGTEDVKEALKKQKEQLKAKVSKR